jgi:hypothetical protein
LDETLELLIRLQGQVILCRRLAAEISDLDLETSELLRALADATERRAREIDAMG